MTQRAPLALRLIAVLAAVHALGLAFAVFLAAPPSAVVLLLGFLTTISAAASCYAVWNLKDWALRALLAWGVAAPLFAVTLFASLFPERMGSTAWKTVLNG